MTSQIDAAAPRAEALALLGDLVRVDTTNPPGAETAAALLLRDFLQARGVECEIVARDEQRANLVARVPGGGDGPSLALLAHTDVVYADPSGWQAPPFGGEVLDGHLWGRGALDMKGQLACSAACLAELARRDAPPAGDVVLIAAADEEDGLSDVGITWLVRARPDLRTDFALNEGGGQRVPLAGGRALYLLAVGEKAQLTVRVSSRARGGHASRYDPRANALGPLADALHALLAHESPPALTPAVRALADAVAPGGAAAAERLAAVRAAHPVLDALVPALTGTTVAPTVVAAARRVNVVPGEASVLCDCRALPGADEGSIVAEVEALVRGLSVEVEACGPLWGGSASPAGTALERACRAALSELEPEGGIVPLVFPGYTDSHVLRQAFGTVAYGFLPLRHTDPLLVDATVHAADERIHVADLEAGTSFLLAVVDELGRGATRAP